MEMKQSQDPPCLGEIAADEALLAGYLEKPEGHGDGVPSGPW